MRLDAGFFSSRKLNVAKVLIKAQKHNYSSLTNMKWTTELFRFHQYEW